MSDPKPFAWIVSNFLGMSVPVGSGCLVVAGETVGVATLALAEQRSAAINSAVAAREREAAAKALRDLATCAGQTGTSMTREQFVGASVIVSEALRRADAIDKELL